MAFLASILGSTISLLFNEVFFLESDDDLEVWPADGLLNFGLIGTKVVFGITWESKTQESNEYSTTISSSTSLLKDAHTKYDLSESGSVVSGIISSITQLLEDYGSEFEL